MDIFSNILKGSIKDYLFKLTNQHITVKSKHVKKAISILNKNPFDYSMNCPICLSINEKFKQVLKEEFDDYNIKVQVSRGMLDFYKYSKEGSIIESFNSPIAEFLTKEIILLDNSILKIVGNKDEETDFINNFKEIKFKLI